MRIMAAAIDEDNQARNIATLDIAQHMVRQAAQARAGETRGGEVGGYHADAMMACISIATPTSP
jgi:hypothetical protein